MLLKHEDIQDDKRALLEGFLLSSPHYAALRVAEAERERAGEPSTASQSVAPAHPITPSAPPLIEHRPSLAQRIELLVFVLVLIVFTSLATAGAVLLTLPTHTIEVETGATTSTTTPTTVIEPPVIW